MVGRDYEEDNVYLDQCDSYRAHILEEFNKLYTLKMYICFCFHVIPQFKIVN